MSEIKFGLAYGKALKEKLSLVKIPAFKKRRTHATEDY